MYQHHDAALYDRIYLVVEQIPFGLVASYGEVAMVLGGAVDGQIVGYALASLPKARIHTVPWHRVVARDGAISTRGSSQQALLEAEGVRFDASGRVSMPSYSWNGPPAAWAEQHGMHSLPERGERAEQLSLFE